VSSSLWGCTTIRDTQPKETATEQLLLSTAVDRAVAQLDLHIPPGSRIYFDTSEFEAQDAAKYTLGTIENRLLQDGAKLADSKANADLVLAPRAGALAIDQDTFLIGIPSYNIPIPLAGALSTPEIALYKRAEEKGVAKFAVTGYGAKDGALRASAGPSYGYSHDVTWVVAIVISWNRDDLIPVPDRDKGLQENQ
jgi:hypothetical protein